MVAKRKSKGKKRGSSSKAKKLNKNSYFVSGISNGAIKRLARKGGIIRASAEIYSEIRKIYGLFLDKLVMDSWSYCECARRKTIKPIDVIYALKRQGRNMYGYVHDHEVGGHNGITHDEESDK